MQWHQVRNDSDDGLESDIYPCLMLDQTGRALVDDFVEGSFDDPAGDQFDDLLGDQSGDLVGDLVELYE